MRTKFLNNSLALYVGFAALAALLLALFAFVSKQAQDYRDVQQLIATRQALHRILNSLQEAEAGQLGYLLTDDPSYLRPYERALGGVGPEFEALKEKIDSAGDELVQLDALRTQAEQKLAEVRKSIALQSTEKHEEALAIVKDGGGRALMERLRDGMEALAMHQQQRIDAQSRGAETAGGLLRVGAIGGLLMAIVIGYAAIRQLSEQLREIAAVRDGLQEANAALSAEVEQREKLSEQLRQSQKMEAIGHLTGGLAHDFNNMLAVIVSSVNLAKRRLAAGDGGAGRYLDSALEGAERAATLTHRLLAFSRRQPLSPEPIDPNKMVAGMAELLRRTLGETVHLEAVFAGGLWRAHADPSQLETAILNLALNARDAMPEGGKLTIETSNAFLDENYAAREMGIPAGPYILIAITDTGAGMSPEVMERAFDPFFTTKPVGHGTGLGLSQVYGFVRQSGGHVKIYSEPGQGTTVKIYMPRYHGPLKARETSEVATRAAPRAAQNETILIVEDDERVRRLTVDTLSELGYRVAQAEGAAAALRALENDPSIALLFTDIVMPETNGRKLAEEARKLRPELKVLFTTGYTRNAVVHNGVLDSGVDLIVKPYSMDQLARKLREILDRPLDASPPEAPADDRARRVLVVDDDFDVAESLAALLRLKAYEVRTAHDAQAALFVAQTFRPDAVLLDLGLPGTDGYQVARQLRAIPEGREILLIALTGFSGDSTRIACEAAGFDDHLVKPTDIDALKLLLDMRPLRSRKTQTP